MESLVRLTIEEVDLGENLESLEKARLPNLGELALVSVRIKSMEGLKTKNLPLLRVLSFERNPELRLDEDICGDYLQGVEKLRMVWTWAR